MRKGNILLYETTITLASKISAGGICDSLNDDLTNLVDRLSEFNLDRQREF